MKTNPNDPTQPIVQSNNYDGVLVMEAQYNGLTKREHFAAMALSGCQGYEYKGCESPADVASRAVEIADALIKALNKEGQ